ncbi:hypothetical protein CEXT_736211 [Caerostris extrusa]|uniref:Uncharacterized protein n=1 Tax=Caerostris extrusa TaxID=172846 RepID=A0AAV4MSW8_CAEEX|nr:hypothetical protein CEXT_736211 [Caerostris extrusa]
MGSCPRPPTRNTQRESRRFLFVNTLHTGMPKSARLWWCVCPLRDVRNMGEVPEILGSLLPRFKSMRGWFCHELCVLVGRD